MWKNDKCKILYECYKKLKSTYHLIYKIFLNIYPEEAQNNICHQIFSLSNCMQLFIFYLNGQYNSKCFSSSFPMYFGKSVGKMVCVTLCLTF